MFKKIKGAMKKMQEKTVEAVNTAKKIMADPQSRFVAGFILGSLSLGMMGSALMQMKGVI